MQIIIQGGQYDGYQAIVLQPAKPFPIMRLSEELRHKIYREYFAPLGLLNGSIKIESKRKKDSSYYAKSYTEGSKYRVSLLVVNKEVCTARSSP